MADTHYTGGEKSNSSTVFRNGKRACLTERWMRVCWRYAISSATVAGQSGEEFADLRMELSGRQHLNPV